MGRYIVVFVLLWYLGFCVFVYYIRTNYNVDKHERKDVVQNYEIDVRRYAHSIIPKDVKNDVFFNAIKEKFPYIEEHENLRDLIKDEKKKKEDEETVAISDVKKERVSIVGAMNMIVGDITD